MVNRGREIFLLKNFAVISDRGNISNTRQLGIFYTLSRWNFEYQKSFDSKNRADICFEWKILISSTSIQTRLLTELKLNPEFLSIRSNFSIDFPSFQSPSIARNGSSISWSEVTCFLFETFEIPGSPFIVRSISITDQRIDFNARSHPRFHGRSRKSKFADGERAKAGQVLTWYESVFVSQVWFSFLVCRWKNKSLSARLRSFFSDFAACFLCPVEANAII